MIVKLLLASSILFPSPGSPRATAAFNQMVTDYAFCHAYYDFAYNYFDLKQPGESTRYLGAQANAGYEAHRLEVLANLPDGTFEKRQMAAKAEMQKTLDSNGFPALYSVYESFCDTLHDDPGGSFIRRLPPEKSTPRSMKTGMKTKV